MTIDLSDEAWRSVVGYEGLYEVSDQGRVRSLDRIVPGRTRWGTMADRRFRGKIIKPILVNGYVYVSFSRNGCVHRRPVHQLVLEAFVGSCPLGMQGCHGNDVGDDNRLVNLRWDTPQSNILDSVKNGGHFRARQTHCLNGHEFTPENTRNRAANPGWRTCKECERAWGRERARRIRREFVS